MGWIGWVILGVCIVGYTGAYVICKAASDADDKMLGDRQYEQN